MERETNNSTQMTQIRQISTDLISVNQHNQCHQRSILFQQLFIKKKSPLPGSDLYKSRSSPAPHAINKQQVTLRNFVSMGNLRKRVKNFNNLLTVIRQIIFCNVPDYFIVYSKVFMHYPVSKIIHFIPGYFRILVFYDI
jgi:hypothetical protein